jgi:hypothetical protein
VGFAATEIWMTPVPRTTGAEVTETHSLDVDARHSNDGITGTTETCAVAAPAGTTTTGDEKVTGADTGENARTSLPATEIPLL